MSQLVGLSFGSPKIFKPPVVDREYKFVREPDDSLKCPICLGIAEDPHQHGTCGKLFCKRCINIHGKGKSCPICKEENAKYFEDTRGTMYLVCILWSCMV